MQALQQRYQAGPRTGFPGVEDLVTHVHMYICPCGIPFNIFENVHLHPSLAFFLPFDKHETYFSPKS